MAWYLLLLWLCHVAEAFRIILPSRTPVKRHYPRSVVRLDLVPPAFDNGVGCDSSSLLLTLLPQPLVVASALLALPVVVAAIQGGISVINFRRNYAKAPVPKIPSHGVVIAVPINNNNATTSTAEVELPEKCLRLLLIGDSLAVAVGQSVSSTPVMPETIAKQISKSTHAAVYWTCFGETGASTPWIIRMIEQSNVQKYDEFKCPEDVTNNEYEGFQAEGVLANDPRYKTIVLEWKQKLGDYRKSFRELYFDPESWGTFDIVILLTGTNDIKSLVFPFLLDEEDKELRRQIKNRKAGLIQDVQLFMETLTRKMERGLNRTIGGLIETTEGLSESVRQNLEEFEKQLEQVLFFDTFNDTNSSKPLAPLTGVIENPQLEPCSNATSHGIFIRPLFALPGSPVRLVPACQKVPFRWFARPVFDMMDSMKKKFAESASHDIMFVEDPKIADAIDFEARRGILWNEQNLEIIVLSIRAISDEERLSIESNMRSYYDSKGVLYDTVHAGVPLSEWNGKPGSKIFSVDTIHPNEAGYTMWGRHIGRAIAKHLEEEYERQRLVEAEMSSS